MDNADFPAMPIALTENMVKLMEHEKALRDWSKVFGGMSKREYFAAMAMQGLCHATNPAGEWHHDAETVALASVEYADTLLAELERTK